MKPYISYVLSSALLLGGCAKEAVQDDTTGLQRISAGLNDDSKISLTDQTTSLTLAWEADDAIRVIGANGSSLFNILPGFTVHQAEFEGKIVIGGPYTLIYPGNYASAAAVDARDLTVQTQRGNGSTAHLEYNAVLSSVSDYHSFAFTSSWASANGASFRENGVLKLHLQTPTGISQVSKLVISANADVFYTTNGGSGKTSSLTLLFEDTTVASPDYLLDAYLDLSCQTATLPAGSMLRVTLTTGTGEYYKVIFPGAMNFAPGRMSVINVNDGNWYSTSAFAGGDGTEGNPYLIANYIHMNNMGAFLVDGETVWFEMVNDVDMNPNDAGYWTPLNSVSTYDKGVHFDGKGHTIHNFSIKSGTLHNGMFAILNGTVQNVTFNKPLIIDDGFASTSNHDVGFVAGYAGYTANGKTYSGNAVNVKVKDGEIATNSTLHTGGVGFGAIFGSGAFCTVSGCRVNGFTISDQDKDGTVPNIMGGIIGRTSSSTTTIRNCSAKNLSFNGFSFIGGILAYNNTPAAVVIDSCSTSGTIQGKQYLGGIVGGAAASATGLSITRAESAVNISSSIANSYLGGIMGGHNGFVTITNSKASGNLSTGTGFGSFTGGILGNCALAGCTITDCSYSGNITVNGNYVGGILGKSVERTTITNCKCSGILTSGGTYSSGTAPEGRLGGIVGQLGTAAATNSTISGCVFSGQLKSNSNYSKDAARYIGGIAGAAYGVNIHHCLVTGSLGGKAHETHVAGLCAYANVCTVNACEFRGTTTYATGTMGGLFGGINGNCTISNCLFNGNLTGGYNVGGIIANPNNASNTLSFSSNLVLGQIKGIGGVGGVIGLMGRTQGSLTVEKNLVYCTSIEGTRTKDCNSNRSCGTIIGELAGSAYTLNNTNYFSSSVNFTDGASGVSDRVTTPTEQSGNYTTSSPLTWSYSATYFHPYYGRKTTSTASAMATSLGWSTTYWELSGSAPVLKDMPSAE